MADYYTLGFERDAADGTIIETMGGASELRFIIRSISELDEDARAEEKQRGKKLKIYRVSEVADALVTDEELD